MVEKPAKLAIKQPIDQYVFTDVNEDDWLLLKTRQVRLCDMQRQPRLPSPCQHSAALKRR